MVQADNSIAIMIDNKIVDMISAEAVENEGGVIASKTNTFTISTQSMYTLIKTCIRYMVEMQNAHSDLKDYWFYNNHVKKELRKSDIYSEVMEKWELKNDTPYGLSYRLNKAGQQELQRDPEAAVSIFDTHCFIFYLVKYCEIFGIEAVIACQEHISYNQKRKIVEHVTNNELRLGVDGQSWKHCLLHMFLNGVISRETFVGQFKSDEDKVPVRRK